MANQNNKGKHVRSPDPGLAAQTGPSWVESPGPNLPWFDGVQDFWSARARLDTGGLVYLSVERLVTLGWEWLVWDAGGQAPPRHGAAATEGAAKRQAAKSMRQVNALLLDVLGGATRNATARPRT